MYTCYLSLQVDFVREKSLEPTLTFLACASAQFLNEMKNRSVKNKKYIHLCVCV